MSPSNISTGGSSSRSNEGSSSSSSTAVSKEVDGKAIAIQLAGTLFELSLTLAASYYFSRWLAKKIQGDATSGMDGYTDEAVDGGSGGPGVLPRLKKLLAARHEATLVAMMEELEDHQLLWKEQQEEKKQESDQQLNNIDNSDEQRCLQEQTKNQYAQLEQELIQQHERSLSTLNSLSSYEMSIAQVFVFVLSRLSVPISFIGGMVIS